MSSCWIGEDDEWKDYFFYWDRIMLYIGAAYAHSLVGNKEDEEKM